MTALSSENKPEQFLPQQNAQQLSSQEIEIWKMKRLIKMLDSITGNGTSMISLIIPPKDQLFKIIKNLEDERGSASNIKSRVNRLSVLTAIETAIQCLKSYSKVPPNGLIVYCGLGEMPGCKEKKIHISFEPYHPLNTSLYYCDDRFHTEELGKLCVEKNRFGFIITDGHGTLFAVLSGDSKTILHKFTVNLPNKHGRGGQSAKRFSRLREEKRHNYLRKIAEMATLLFIGGEEKVNISGLILGGSADLKSELNTSDLLDPRLMKIIVKIVDISYGGESGFNEAINHTTELLSGVKLVQEKKIIKEFFEEIEKDTGLYCFGVKHILAALEAGVLKDIMVWENLSIMYDGCNIVNSGNILLIEWLADQYVKYGTTLHIITDKSPEGSQFINGFGGIGGILRYPYEFIEDDSNIQDPEEFVDLSEY